MDTLSLLYKHFDDRPYVGLDKLTPFWGHSEKTMKDKIDTGKVRLAYFTLDGNQKSRKLVSVQDVARLIEEKASEADRDFSQLWS